MSDQGESSPRGGSGRPGVPGTATCRTERPGVSVINLVGDFDADSAKELTRAFEEAARGGGRTIADCTGITFADVFLLHTLLDANTTHDLTLAGPPPYPLLVLLDGTGTTDRFTITPDLHSALDQ